MRATLLYETPHRMICLNAIGITYMRYFQNSRVPALWTCNFPNIAPFSGEDQRRRDLCLTRPSSPTRSSPRRSHWRSPRRTTCTETDLPGNRRNRLPGKFELSSRKENVVTSREIKVTIPGKCKEKPKTEEKTDSKPTQTSEIYTLSSLQENNCDTSP